MVFLLTNHKIDTSSAMLGSSSINETQRMTMKRFKTIDSSKITWTIYPGDLGCNVRSFCADGDGMVVVEEYADNIYALYDQDERLGFWRDVKTPDQLAKILEIAQDYLQANYQEVYEDAMHWNDEPTTDDLRQQMNAINGHGHLN